MADAVSRIINHVFTKDWFLLQPPNAKSWSAFDKAIFDFVYDQLTDGNFTTHPHLSNAKSIQTILDVIRGFFFNMVTKVATQHRYEGRYNHAYDVWMHLFDYMAKINYNKEDFPLHFGNHYVTICVMYMHWSGMSNKKKAELTLNQCQQALECVKIAKQLRKFYPTKYKYETCFPEIENDEFAIEAQAYHHMGNAYNYLKNEKLERFFYEKTFKIYSEIDSNEFTGNCVKSQIHYFMVDYTNNLMLWDPLKKSKLIRKLTTMNINEAKQQFGEISLEVVQTVKVKGDYHLFLLSEHDTAIKQYTFALNIAFKVLTKCKASGEIFFCGKVLNCMTEIFEHLGTICERFGDFCGATVHYSASMEFVQRMFVECNKGNDKQLIKREKILKKGLERLESYDPSKELHRNCKVCYKYDKKMRKKCIKNGVKRYLHRIGKISEMNEEKLDENNEDQVLKNIGRYRRCKYCSKANRKLWVCKGCKSVFYCSQKHQKFDWKKHKNECKLMKSSKPSESYGSYVEMLEKINKN